MRPDAASGPPLPEEPAQAAIASPNTGTQSIQGDGDVADPQAWPPFCPDHPQQRMRACPRGWGWICPIDRAAGQPSPQPARPVTRDGRTRWLPIPLTPPAPKGRRG